MSRYRNRRRKLLAEINVVPYIDVMLVLLIIFMITAPLLQQGIEVDLPRTSSSPVPPTQSEPVVLSIDKKGRYYLNVGEKVDQSISLATVKKKIAIVLKNKPKTPVLVKGDKGVAYGRVITAMASLQAAGVPKVGLITEMPESTKSKR